MNFEEAMIRRLESSSILGIECLGWSDTIISSWEGPYNPSLFFL